VATTQNPVLKEFSTEDLPTDFLHHLGASALLRGISR
jgi:hypothetical protein